MKRISQVSSMAMMLALAACGGGGGNNGGGGGGGGDGGGQTPSGSLPQGATFSSSSGVASLSGESVTVNGTTYDNVNDDETTGVRTYTASTSGTAAATDVEGDEVIASRVGADTLGATLNSGVYGAYVTGTDAELGSTSMGFYGGVNTTDAPTTGDASYSGGALGIETVIDGDGNETLTSYTGDMTATVDFETEANNTVGLDYDEFGTITSAGGSLSDTNMLSDGTVTVTGDAAANYTGGTNTLSAQLVGAAGAEMVGDVSLASAAATEGDSYKFSGGFGGVKGDDTTPPGDGGAELGSDVPSSSAQATPSGTNIDRSSLESLTVNYDPDGAGGGNPLPTAPYELDNVTVDGDNLLVYRTDTGTSGTVDDTDIAFATRIDEESLEQTLNFTSFGVWSADVATADNSVERRFGSFYNGDALSGGFTPSSGTANYIGKMLAIESTTAGSTTTRTKIDGDMTATLDLGGGTEAVDVNLDLDDSNSIAFAGLDLDNATGTFGSGANSALTGTGNYSSATGFTGGNGIGGALLGTNASRPEEIGGAFRVLNVTGRAIAGSFGGTVDTAP